MPPKSERRFNLLSRIFLLAPPLAGSGGRKTAGRVRLPLKSSWPAATDGVQDSHLELSPPSPPLCLEPPAPETVRVSEVAPRLPALDLGPAFKVDFGAVPGWGKISSLERQSTGLRKRLEFGSNGYWKRGLSIVDDSYTGNYEQNERFMVLRVVVVVLGLFWLVYGAGWIISLARERVRGRRRMLPL